MNRPTYRQARCVGLFRFLDFQNRRGGRVILQMLPAPQTEFNDVEKGDALNVRERRQPLSPALARVCRL